MSPIRIRTTDERLDAVRARAAAATAGPWHITTAALDGNEVVLAVPVEHDHTVVAATGPKGQEQAALDAVFIAGARSDVPWLLAEVDRLRAEKVRGWDAALDGANELAGAVVEREQLRGQLAEACGQGQLPMVPGYGVAPEEFDRDDVVTAQRLWEAMRSQFDPNDAWEYSEIGPLLRTFVAVLTQRRAETSPDGTSLREQLQARLDRALELAERLMVTLASGEQGHPGEPCVRTRWIKVATLNRWHAELAELRRD